MNNSPLLSERLNGDQNFFVLNIMMRDPRCVILEKERLSCGRLEERPAPALRVLHSAV